MNLDFLTPATGVPAESPMAAAIAREGAAFVVRDGWRVVARFAGEREEADALATAVGWVDVSHLRKVELHGEPAAMAGLAVGAAEMVDGAWHCRLTPRRALVIGAAVEHDPALHPLDVTTQFAALRIAGPAARETLARFCALDLRAAVTPPASVRPGSVARTPGLVVCEGEDRFLVLVGAAFGEYFWEVVSDAGRHLGGRPVGLDAMALSHA